MNLKGEAFVEIEIEFIYTHVSEPFQYLHYTDQTVTKITYN